MFSIAIDRSNGVNHVLCGEPAAAGNHSLSRRQAPNLAHNLPALSQDSGSTRAMNGAINTAAAQKRRIRRVHYRAGRLASNVGRTVKLDGLATLHYEPGCKLVHRIQTDHFLFVSAS